MATFAVGAAAKVRVRREPCPALPCPGGTFPKPVRALQMGRKRSFPFIEGGTKGFYHPLGKPQP